MTDRLLHIPPTPTPTTTTTTATTTTTTSPAPLRFSRTTRARRPGKGFTLIEVLVVVAIVAALISLAVVGLRGARKASAALACRAHIRNAAQITHTYANDQKGWLPFFADPKSAPAFRNAGMGFQYNQQVLYWTIPLQGYLSQPRVAPEQFCPSSELFLDVFKRGRREERLSHYTRSFILFSDYELTLTAAYDPRFFTPAGDTPPSPARPVALAEAAYPARKGLFVEPRPAHRGEAMGRHESPSLYYHAGRRGPFHVAFFDAHAEEVDFDRLTPGHTRPGDTTLDLPVHGTPSGVLGDDLKGRASTP